MPRRKLIALGCAAAISAGLALTGPAATAGSCKYKGGKNALPTGGLPVLLYADGDMTPSGVVGIGDGTGDNYVQAGGSSTGGQVEAKSAAAGQSVFANTGGGYGSC